MLLTEPPGPVLTVTVNDTVCPVVPAASEPILKTTLLPTTIPPFVADTKVVPAGSGSVMTTFEAAAVPVFP